MSVPAPGGAPVGRLDTLDPLDGLAVRAFRLWCDGGPERLAEGLDAALGSPFGGQAAAAFDALCRGCVQSCRRPLLRHGPACPCLGADEAALAELLRLATEGEREDALMLACVMVRIDRAPLLVELAQRAGLALRRAALGRPSGAALH